MNEDLPLAGTVVGVVGTGTDANRAVAVGCAERGADIALATEAAVRDQDFAMNSIANEVWALGREHFVEVIEANSETLRAFVEKAQARFGRLDVIVVRRELVRMAPQGVRVLVAGAGTLEAIQALV